MRWSSDVKLIKERKKLGSTSQIGLSFVAIHGCIFPSSSHRSIKWYLELCPNSCQQLPASSHCCPSTLDLSHMGQAGASSAPARIEITTQMTFPSKCRTRPASIHTLKKNVWLCCGFVKTNGIFEITKLLSPSLTRPLKPCAITLWASACIDMWGAPSEDMASVVSWMPRGRNSEIGSLRRNLAIS